MHAVNKSFCDLIGNTPIVELQNLQKKLGLKSRLYAKLEYFNPGGSVKDRVALAMINDAEKRGVLKPGACIIEPTSGNTGIGLAAVAVSKGYRAILTMPETMSRERRLLLQAYGAEIELTPGEKGMKGAIRRAEELAKEISPSFVPSQFDNPANPKAHYESTGPEIYSALEANLDYFVAGVGTGGTVTGVGRYLKEQNDQIKVVAVEPADSPVISGGEAGPHKLQGIGAGFIPKVLDMQILDEVLPVTNEEAYEAARLVSTAEAIFVGISSGAALSAAIKIARREEGAGRSVSIALVFPDTGERYLSVEGFI